MVLKDLRQEHDSCRLEAVRIVGDHRMSVGQTGADIVDLQIRVIIENGPP
jgi:hypothetical protein